MCNKKHKLYATVYDKRGRILSHATNSYVQTHPRQAKYAQLAGLPEKVYLHAEISAIIKCRDKITKAHRIRVERFDKKGNPKNAAPCPICLIAIQEAGIKVVEHTMG